MAVRPGGISNTSWFVVDHGVRVLLSATPRVARKMLGKALRRVGQTFGYHFTAQRLGGRPGIHVLNKGRGTVGSNVKLPRQMRKIGFKARVWGERPGSPSMGLWIGTRSPVLLVHEKGEQIAPRSGKFLLIHVRTLDDAARFKLPVGSVFLARRVRVPGRLGFLMTWRAYEYTARSILNEAVAQTIGMINSGVRS